MINNKDLIEEYLNFYRHSKQSVKMRNSCLRFFFGEYYPFGNGKIDGDWFNYKGPVFDITTQLLKEYFTHLKNLDSISIITRKNKWIILISFLRFIMEDYPEFLITIPSKRISWNNAINKKKPVKSNKRVFATKEELKKILGYFQTRNYKHYLIFRLFVETGIRKGELINAKVSELNLKERYINIHKGKTDMKYYIFSESLINPLRMYLNERNKITTNSENLFLNKDLDNYGIRSFNLALEYARRELNISERITCHTFRRTINDFRKEMGCSNEDRKILLGHKTNDVNVEGYTRSDFIRLRELYDKWNPYKRMKL